VNAREYTRQATKAPMPLSPQGKGAWPRIVELALKAGLTSQGRIARKLGASDNTVSNWKKGVGPDIEYARKLGALFGVPYTEFLAVSVTDVTQEPHLEPDDPLASRAEFIARQRELDDLTGGEARHLRSMYFEGGIDPGALYWREALLGYRRAMRQAPKALPAPDLAAEVDSEYEPPPLRPKRGGR